MPRANPHLNVETLKAYGLGRVEGAAAETILQHLETCVECRQAVADATVIRDFSESAEAARPVEGAGPEANTSSGRPPSDVDQFRAATTLPPPVAPVFAGAAAVAAPVAVEPIPVALASSPDYEVLREISRGGMGVVYLARNRRMYRLEALKVVNEALLQQSGALERFEREMQAAARLNHSNIVIAYSSPPLDGLLAFAMEFVDGVDLYELVQARGPLPVSNACYYVYQAAQGLQHAHDRQMVHRDIKPHNLMLTRDGKKQVIKILDFGLAKATSENQIGAGLTGTGQMLGTPHYMAPEQIDNAAKADIRADIYSLGCTLYHLLAGYPPFHDKAGLLAILRAHGTDTARLLHEVRPDVTTESAGIVARMMSKDAAQRYQQPSEVAQALTPYFKRGVRPIPTGTARFAAPRPAAVAPAPVQTPADPPADGNKDELNPMHSMLDCVDDPAPSRGAKRSGSGGSLRTALKVIPPKIWIGMAAGILLVAGLGLWRSGVFTLKPKSGESAAITKGEVANRGRPAQMSCIGEKIGQERDDNSLNLSLVWCPPGKFTMGSPKSELGREDFEFQVRVTLTKGFWLRKHEVTQGEYERIIGTNPSGHSASGHSKADFLGMATSRFPVENVSYEDSLVFCRKMTEQEQLAGRLSAGWEYTLPTEAQWEYACRAGTETPFSFGTKLNGTEANCDGKYPYGTDMEGPELKRTTTVGSYAANAWGLHDMHGNVWEWCRDAMGKPPGGADPEVRSGFPRRVVRGGCYNYKAASCRSAYRYWDSPDEKTSGRGFRVALCPAR